MRSHMVVLRRFAHQALFACGVFGARWAGAQEATVRGLVLDSARSPVPDVAVAVVAVHQVTRTDANGRFTLNVRIPPNCSAKVILPDGATHDVVAGRHEFKTGALADDGIPVLSEITELAS